MIVVVAQLLVVYDSVTPWTIPGFPAFTIAYGLLKLMSIGSTMPSYHHPLSEQYDKANKYLIKINGNQNIMEILCIIQSLGILVNFE